MNSVRRAALIVASCTEPDSTDQLNLLAQIDSSRVITNTSAAWTAAEVWTVRDELRIGSQGEGGPAVFGNIWDIAVSSTGTIFILEGHSQEIRVFDSLGKHVRTIGNRGGGPGEFANALGLRFDRNDQLWVVDPENQQYSVLDTSGMLIQTYRRLAIGGISPTWSGGFTSNGFIEATVRPSETFAGRLRTDLLLVDVTQETIDTLLEIPTYLEELFVHRTRSGGSFTLAVPSVRPSYGPSIHEGPSGWLSTGTTRSAEST